MMTHSTTSASPCGVQAVDEIATCVQIEWPAGVLARYLTVGGATADVIDDVIDNRPEYLSMSHAVRGMCTGERCGESHWTVRYTFRPDDDPEQDEDFRQTIAEVQWWARGHAERCRAMPKPQR